MDVEVVRKTEDFLIEDIIYSIARVLDEIVQETDIIESAVQTVFHTNKKPSISLFQYLGRIQKYSYCSNECFILALIFIDRVQEKNQDLVITSYCIHRFLLACILISIKYNDDDYYKNAYYAKVGGVSLQELNTLESELLDLLNYELYVSQRQYYHYQDKLTKYSKL